VGAKAERLMKCLRSQGVTVPDGSTLHRTHAGRLQRSSGAWSWFLLDPAGRVVCGGYSSVTDLLRGALSVSEDTNGSLNVELDRAEQQ